MLTFVSYAAPPVDDPFVRKGTTVLMFADTRGAFFRVVNEDDINFPDPIGPFAKALQMVRDLRRAAKP